MITKISPQLSCYDTQLWNTINRYIDGYQSIAIAQLIGLIHRLKMAHNKSIIGCLQKYRFSTAVQENCKKFTFLPSANNKQIT